MSGAFNGRVASLGVAGAMGVRFLSASRDSVLPRDHSEARCPSCDGALRFFLGGYGEMLEVCTTKRCELARPHRAAPAPGTKMPRPEQPRKSRAQYDAERMNRGPIAARVVR